jgi:maltose O-acetyltransferase
MSEKQKMLHGELYFANDLELAAERERTQAQLLRLNANSAPEQRLILLQSPLGSMGESVTIRSPFFCDYGYNIHAGRDVFLNFNCVLLDVMPIHIGDRTQIGPNVQILAADHPRDYQLRSSGFESGKPVTIGKNVWIGGGCHPATRSHHRR